jgi:peptidoglycan hydrolase-like protein with peptidoglycan-binding domain
MPPQRQVPAVGALVPPPMLRVGSKGIAVEELQRRLKTAGLYSGEIDGIYGSQTIKAVQRLQLLFKLPSDGIAGPKTWSVLTGRPQTNASTSNLALGVAQTPALIRTVKVWWNSFIPHAQIDGPIFSECFKGDGRTFSNSLDASHRTHQEIEFELASRRVTVNYRHVGTTHEFDCDTGKSVGTATAPVSQLSNGPVTYSGSRVTIKFSTDATNPLVSLAPAINSAVTFELDTAKRTCKLSGVHDEFPAYEAYVAANSDAGTMVYGYNPIPAGKTPSNLFYSMTLPTTTIQF